MRRGQRVPQFEHEQKAEQHLEICVTIEEQQQHVKSIWLLTWGAASQKAASEYNKSERRELH